jgi:hypothetical protein
MAIEEGITHKMVLLVMVEVEVAGSHDFDGGWWS